MLKEISTDDLERLSKCLETAFGQLYENDVLVSGETPEENLRFARMYQDIGTYLHNQSGGEIDATYEYVKNYVDNYLKQTIQ